MKFARRALLTLVHVGFLAASATAGADEPTPSKAASTPEAPPASRPAVWAALKRSDTSVVTDLSKASANQDGAGLQLGSGTGLVGATGERLSTIGGATTAQGSSGASNGRAIETPKAEGTVAKVGKPRRGTRSAAAVQSPGADRVIASLAPSFAACAKGTAANVTNPAVIGASLAPTGEVTGTLVVSAGDVAADAVACFRAVIAHAKFEAAGPRGSVLQIRVGPEQLASPPATVAVADAPR